MRDYLIVESGNDAPRAALCPGLVLARALADAGHAVTAFLLQNGVLRARRGIPGNDLAEVRNAGVSLLADDFSLRERGIARDQLAPQVTPSPLETLIDRLVAGHEVIWF